MSQNNLELMRLGDGEVRLAFWDSLHGDDITYILSERGEAFLEVEGGELLEKVNLVDELMKLADRFSKEAETEIQQVMRSNDGLQPTPKGAAEKSC